jgi:hypothetical protein
MNAYSLTNRKTYPILVAALVTVFAHHINNPAEDAPTPVELQTWLQLIIDLGTMIKARGDHTDLTQYRDLCSSLFAKLEVESRVQYALGSNGAATLLGESVPFATFRAA